MPDPEISIIIVSWNVRDLLVACLRSVQKYVRLPYEIIVVDNHSSDGTVELLEHDFPEVTLISNDQNAGFARGNNQGWQKSRGNYIAFLNPDVELTDDVFSPLVTYLQEQNGVGAVGPQLRNPDGSHQPSVRRFPTFADQALILLKLRWLGKILPPLHRYQFYPATTSLLPVVVDQIMGACLVMPRTVLVDGGTFDEGYWIWFEEVDLCRRLKSKGYQVVFLPTAHLIHHGGQSFSQHVSIMKHLWFMKSLGRYANKYWSLSARLGIFLLMPISYILTFVQSLFKPK